ncbi:MAG: putative motility protein [bacterium]|nr:putative motility protein [bacterium]
MISAEQMATTSDKVGISVLKKNMQVEVEVQQQLIQMLNSVQPHLGSNINVTA